MKYRIGWLKKKRRKRLVVTGLFFLIGIMCCYKIKEHLPIGKTDIIGNALSDQENDTNPEDWKLILVNKEHAIPAHYKVALTRLSNGKKVDTRIYPELQKMFDTARAEGLSLFVREGYRTRAEQQKIMDDRIAEYEEQGCSKREAVKKAQNYVALPGTSEHELGLSVDINADTKKCSSDKVYQWLAANAYQYGFVKRFPSDKTKITGIDNEPWHYRYVGKKAAKIMKEKNLCLEEYLQQ